MPWRSAQHSGGQKVLQEFLDAIDAKDQTFTALFDMHNVVDQLEGDEADMVFEVSGFLTILCSFSGHTRRKADFKSNRHAWPGRKFVGKLDGKIFVDSKDHFDLSKFDIDTQVYRESFMKSNEICVRANKGVVPLLLEKPCLLFDDQVINLEYVRDNGSHYATGIWVPWGRHHRADPRTVEFTICNDASKWYEEMHMFARAAGAHYIELANSKRKYPWNVMSSKRRSPAWDGPYRHWQSEPASGSWPQNSWHVQDQSASPFEPARGSWQQKSWHAHDQYASPSEPARGSWQTNSWPAQDQSDSWDSWGKWQP